ncbi:MAG: cytochrome-c peroxidase [Planctomycetota bacterium]
MACFVLATAPAESVTAQTIGSFPTPAVPAGNPLTEEKLQLGKALFFEEQLSSDDTMACATCHLPEAGGTDVRAGAREAGFDGVLGTLDDEFGSPGMVAQDAGADYLFHPLAGLDPQATNRHAPTVIGAAFFKNLFWDQRAGQTFRNEAGQVVLATNAALETQAVAPPLSSVEMAHAGRTWAQVTAKLARVRPLDLASDVPPSLARFIGAARDYRPLFARAFGTEEITRERVAMAIASYERTLVADRTPFDLGTLSDEEVLGELLFRQSFCHTCHAGALFSDGFTHFINLPDHFRGAKTPTLRNIGLQRRLTSSGQFATLEEVVAHYENVGLLFPTPNDDERRALVAFLRNGLTDPRVAAREPPFDRPTLRSELEGAAGVFFGTARPDGSGRAPELLANLPATLGSRDFRYGLAHARTNALALLVVAPNAAEPGATLAGVPLFVLDTDPARQLRLATTSASEPGLATFRLPIAADRALAGTTLFAQAFVLDDTAPTGVTATRAARHEIVSRAGRHWVRTEEEAPPAR